MKRYLKSASLVLAIVFVPILAFVRYMEASSRFDALGWWYSIYVTFAFSVPVAMCFVGFLFVIAKNRGGSAL